MKTRHLLAGAALACLALAVFWPRPAERPDPPPPAAADPPRLTLDQRLDDAGARLVRSVSGETTRQLAEPVALLGGAVSEAAPDFVRLQIRHPDGSDSHCAGGLMEGGWILTAAHCVDGPFLWIEASVGPSSREAWGIARVRFGEAAVSARFEGDGAAAYREDRALLKLPEDLAASLDWAARPWPQGPQTQLEPGEILRVCGMGLYEGVGLSSDLRCAELPVLEVRAAVVRFGGEAALIQQGDSGAIIHRAATGTPVCILSNFQPGDRTRQYCEPWPGAWARGVRAAW